MRLFLLNIISLLFFSSTLFGNNNSKRKWTSTEEIYTRLNFHKKNFNADSTIAWFDEELETWMKGCRGAGIMTKEKDGWKIAYYNLTVLIENEKIKCIIIG